MDDDAAWEWLQKSADNGFEQAAQTMQALLEDSDDEGEQVDEAEEVPKP